MPEETTTRKKAQVGYFDSELHTVVFTEGDTVQSLLSKAGISHSEGESLTDLDGEDVNPTDQAQDGATYLAVRSYKQGN